MNICMASKITYITICKLINYNVDYIANKINTMSDTILI